MMPNIAADRKGPVLPFSGPRLVDAPHESEGPEQFGALLGHSPAMRALFGDLARIAPTDLPLLLEGETGTGKDLAAESVHRASARAEQPYVVFDCGAVAPSLAESELFGHERGAFTGAIISRPGIFEQAHGGTLFLDEIGELPRDVQPKLLRVLEKGEVRRIGGLKTIPVDVRVIAATNRNVLAEVERARFRQDLYFRLAAAHVNVPPLRDHMDDLPLLLEHFLAMEFPPRRPDDLSPQTWEAFRSYSWPGNVRELRNAVRRLLVAPHRLNAEHRSAPTVTFDSDILAQWEDTEITPMRIARRSASDAFERRYLEAVLAKARGNVTRAAAIAEVSRQIMTKLLRKHGLRGRSTSC